jgi:hypothetical protein
MAQRCYTVLEGKYKQPIPYATIGCLNKQMGTFANEKGEFCIDLQKLSAKDTIIISGLGYAPYKVSLTDFSKQDSIYLEEQNILLNEVAIKKSSYKTVSIGNFKKPLLNIGNSYVPNGNSLLATKIEKPAEISQGTIAKIQYRLETESKKKFKKFRMRCRIFKDLNGKPGQDLLTENVVVDLQPNQLMLEVDISKYNLTFDKKYLWVAIETLGYTDENGEFIINQDRSHGKYFPRKPGSKKITVDSLSPFFAIKKIGLESLNSYSTNMSKWLPVLILDQGQNFMFGLTLDY